MGAISNIKKALDVANYGDQDTEETDLDSNFVAILKYNEACCF